VSGYLITNRKATLKPLAPKAELGWWYQYYFATENGVLGYTANRVKSKAHLDDRVAEMAVR
jgi:hypothetical protein